MPPLPIKNQHHFTDIASLKEAAAEAMEYYNFRVSVGDYRYGQAVFNCLAASNWSHASLHFAGTSFDPYYWRNDTTEEKRRFEEFFDILALFIKGSPGVL